jgi:hypothetical protein
MTLEYLAEKKAQYENKYDYFQKLEFNNLATDFKGVVDLIGEMENYIKEKDNGKD